MLHLESRSQSSPLERRLRRLSRGERVEEARTFIKRYYHETNGSAVEAKQREADVITALRRNGTYHHTAEELAFGARVAWRNHARCI